MQIIKWFDNSAWEQNLVLGGVSYYLSANFNIRDNAWYLSIYTNDNQPLVIGRKLVLNTDILSLVHNELKPKGALIVTPVSKEVEAITRDNMGTEVELIFVSDDELL